MKALFFRSGRLGLRYAWEITFLRHIRSLKDGLTLLEFGADASWYKADHNPKFSLKWEMLNFMIIEFNIYNTHHVQD